MGGGNLRCRDILGLRSGRGSWFHPEGGFRRKEVTAGSGPGWRSRLTLVSIVRSCQSSWYHGTPQWGTRVRVQHRRDRHLAAWIQLRTFALLHTSSKRVKGVALVFYPSMKVGGSTVSTGLGGGVWVCSDTSEVRDVVVLLQHGQGGGVQVVGQACAAHCRRWRGLAPTRAVQRQGGGVPGPAGGGLKGTCEH